MIPYWTEHALTPALTFERKRGHSDAVEIKAVQLPIAATAFEINFTTDRGFFLRRHESTCFVPNKSYAYKIGANCKTAERGYVMLAALIERESWTSRTVVLFPSFNYRNKILTKR